MNPPNPNTERDHTPMTSDLEARIAHALAQAPTVAIPASFASRVTERAFATTLPRPFLWLGWGPRFALASGVLLTVGMFALAPHTPASLTSARFDAELILLAELSGLLLFTHRLLPRE